MSPERVKELANWIDDDLWRLSGSDQMKLPEEMKKRLDAGVQLRRYASLLQDIENARLQGRSLVVTAYTASSWTREVLDTPPHHAELRRKWMAGGAEHHETVAEYRDRLTDRAMQIVDEDPGNHAISQAARCLLHEVVRLRGLLRDKQAPGTDWAPQTR